MEEVLAVVDFTEEVLPVAVSTAVAFVATVLIITDSLMMSSSVATVTRGGGTGTIRTDTTVTAITRTVTMDTADTPTMGTAGTVTTVAAATDTAMAADQGIPGVSVGGNKPVRCFEAA